jgi:hypothetical protein
VRIYGSLGSAYMLTVGGDGEREGDAPLSPSRLIAALARVLLDTRVAANLLALPHAKQTIEGIAAVLCRDGGKPAYLFGGDRD